MLVAWLYAISLVFGLVGSAETWHNPIDVPYPLNTSLPSQECGKYVQQLRLSEAPLGRGSFGIVYSGQQDTSAGITLSQHSSSTIIMPLGMSAICKGSNVAVKVCKKMVRKSTIHSDTNAELAIMNRLRQLEEEGRSHGFVRLLGHFECGQMERTASGKWEVDPSSPRDHNYMIMERLDKTLRAELARSDLTIQGLAAYMFETLFAIQTAYTEIGYIARDLNADNILVSANPYCSMDTHVSGYYQFELASGQKYFIPRALNDGRYVKIIDFGLSRLLKGDVRAFQNDPHHALPPSTLHGLDQFYIATSFIHLTPTWTLKKWKAKHPRIFKQLEDVFKKLLSFPELPRRMSSRFHSPKFLTDYNTGRFDLIYWSMRFKFTDNYSTLLKLFNARPVLPLSTISDALVHPLFSDAFLIQVDPGVDKMKSLGFMRYDVQFKPAQNKRQNLFRRMMDWIKRKFRRLKAGLKRRRS